MRFSVRLLVVLAAVAAFPALSAQDRRGDPRVIVISIDGLMPSSYSGRGEQAPNLRALAREGVWADGVVSVLPTNTCPAHTTLITGVEPAVHGIA